MNSIEISLIIPVYQSSLSLDGLFKDIQNILDNNFKTYELILVNDNSSDDSWDVIKSLCGKYPWVKGINLRKNVGQHNATFVGLKHSVGNIIVTMDDDGQNNPKDIIALSSEVKKGFDVCFANYRLKKHNLFRRLGSLLNDIIINILFKKSKNLKINAFRCFNREISNEIIKNKSPYIYIDGIILSLTSNITKVMVDHDQRKFGKSNYSFFKLINLWIIVATGYSIVPLRIASLLGIIFSIFGFTLSIIFVLQTLISSDAPSGWASLIVVILTIGGIQLFALGIMGEYLGKSYLTINNQPQYSIKNIINKENQKKLE